jgi:hypothetical protein
LRCNGLSELVSGEEALFLSALEGPIEIQAPEVSISTEIFPGGGADQLFGQVAGFALLLLLLQLIDQIHGVVEADALAEVDGGYPQGGCDMGLAGTGATDQDEITGLIHEGGDSQLLDLGLLQGRFRPDETQ